MMAFDFAVFFEKLEKAFKSPDILLLRQLSNEAISEAVIENSRLIAKIALVCYCLHKLSTKEHIVQNKNWQKVRQSALKNIENAKQQAESKNLAEMEKLLDSIILDVKEIDKELGFFLTSLFDKAKIKLASTAYVMGLSLGQAAELTGADKKQLMQYIANTIISEEEKPETGITERIQKIKKFLVKQ